MRTRGTSYFFASILFPQSIKSEVMTLYAFVRFFDDIVDHEGNNKRKDKKILEKYRQEVENARTGKKVKSTIINDFIDLAKYKDIKKYLIDDFLDAMEMDTQKKRYTSYKELHDYMYGSAEVIGLMMIQLIGYEKKHEKQIIVAAKQLGEAMQYTNFLRDTKEDWEKYRRIYLPIDELKKHGLSHKSIIAYCTKKQSPENHRKQFMKEQIQKTRKIYRTSEKFILHLNTSGQLPVRMALSMYEAILDNIEQKDYNVFGGNTKTSLRKKSRIFLKTLRKCIPQWHRWIWIGMTILFAASTRAYLLDISMPLRENPWITPIIFVTATLPIVFQNKQRRGKIVFIMSMLFIEAIGQNTGFPFGEYIYHSPRKEIGIFGVPIFIAFSRLLLINIASNIAKNWRGTVLLVIAIDLVLEPFATYIMYRTWNGKHFLTAPWTNYLARGIIGGISYRIVRKRKMSRFRSLLMYLTIFVYASIVVFIH